MTRNRDRIYEFILRYQIDHGWAPSVREIAKEIGITPSTVHGHLLRLEETAKIKRGPGPRMIRVL